MGPAEDDWVAVSYVWDAGGGEAWAAPEGREKVGGTDHDVPPARQCLGCHGGAPGRVLGFSALQLAHEATADEMSLERLAREGRLTRSPPADLPLPGDPATQRALGYLHANCGHCHNQRRAPSMGPRCFDPQKALDLSLPVERLVSEQATPVHQTALGRLIVPGSPDASPLFRRLWHDGLFRARMPPLATKTVDPAGLTLLRKWIESLPSGVVAR